MFKNRLLISLLIIVLSNVRGVTTPSFGQEGSQPFAVVSIAPLDRSLPDLTYMLSALNLPEMTGVVELMTGFYTKGMDRTRPIGIIMSVEEGDQTQPDLLVCLPMVDHEQWFQAIGGMGLEPEDLGNGLYEIAAAGQYLFAKSTGSWLFMGQSEDSLSSVPDDPETLLGDLPQRYNLAVRVDMDKVSPEARQAAMKDMRAQLDQGLSQQLGDQLGSELEIAREASEAQVEQMEVLMKDVQQIVFGFLTDSAKKQVYVDAAVQFLPGTTLAAQMDAQSKLQSSFAALRLPDAAFNMRLTSSLADEDSKTAAKTSLKEMLGQMEQAMQQSDLPEDRQALLKHLLDSASKVLEQTIDEGVIDAAASLSFENEELRVLAGMRVADGRAIENQLKEFISGLAEASEVEFEADLAEVGQWKIHRLRGELPPNNESFGSLLGEEIEIFVAATDKLLLISLDPNGEKGLRAGIEQMEANKASDVSPLEVVVNVADMVRLMQKVNPDPSLEEMLAGVEQVESDGQVKLTTTALPRGFVFRATIQEGVLRTLGSMARSSNMMPAF